MMHPSGRRFIHVHAWVYLPQAAYEEKQKEVRAMTKGRASLAAQRGDVAKKMAHDEVSSRGGVYVWVCGVGAAVASHTESEDVCATLTMHAGNERTRLILHQAALERVRARAHEILQKARVDEVRSLPYLSVYASFFNSLLLCTYVYLHACLISYATHHTV